jgi:hypothetical protein
VTAEGSDDVVASAKTPFVVAQAGRVIVQPARQSGVVRVGSSRRFVFSVENASDDDDRFRVTVETDSRLVEAPELETALGAGASFELEIALGSSGGSTPETTRLTVKSLAHPERVQTAWVVLLPIEARTDAGSEASCDDDCDASGCGCRVPARHSPSRELSFTLGLAMLALSRRRPWRVR